MTETRLLAAYNFGACGVSAQNESFADYINTLARHFCDVVLIGHTILNTFLQLKDSALFHQTYLAA